MSTSWLAKQIETLNAELDDLKDAFVAEQLRVSHLTKLNKVHTTKFSKDGNCYN